MVAGVLPQRGRQGGPESGVGGGELDRSVVGGLESDVVENEGARRLVVVESLGGGVGDDEGVAQEGLGLASSGGGKRQAEDNMVKRTTMGGNASGRRG